MQATDFFRSQVPAALARAPELFSLGREIGFRVTGARGGSWNLLLTPAPRCVEAEVNARDCALELSDDDFESALRDPANLRDSFIQGRVKVTGNLAIAMHVPALLTLLAAPQLPSGLEQLFQLAEAQQFGREYWPGLLCVSHGPRDRIAELGQINALNSVADLLAVWPGEVRLADRFAGRTVSAAEGQKLYESGSHLAFSDVERVFPILRGTLESLRWQLKLPLSCYGRCLVYASPDSVGETLHFDQNANFVIQLRGEKIWDVAANSEVPLPTERYTVAQPVPSPELQIYGPARLRTALPESSTRVHMKAGSVLFLPRGYWHQTKAIGDSLSLNFTFDQPTWADIVMPEIRRRILAHPQWRELAMGAANLDSSSAEAASQRLQSLLSGLIDDLGPLSANDALARLTPKAADDAR